MVHLDIKWMFRLRAKLNFARSSVSAWVSSQDPWPFTSRHGCFLIPRSLFGPNSVQSIGPRAHKLHSHSFCLAAWYLTYALSWLAQPMMAECCPLDSFLEYNVEAKNPIRLAKWRVKLPKQIEFLHCARANPVISHNPFSRADVSRERTIVALRSGRCFLSLLPPN